MSRKGGTKKRTVLPDPVYGKELISKLVNCVMRHGKKGTAERIVYKAFSFVEQKLKSDPVTVFESAISNVRPVVEVKPRRVGGATYQVPTEVHEVRGTALALKWIIQAAKARSEKTMDLRLGQELVEAYENRGGAITTRTNAQKMAEANRAFAHFRW